MQADIHKYFRTDTELLGRLALIGVSPSEGEVVFLVQCATHPDFQIALKASQVLARLLTLQPHIQPELWFLDVPPMAIARMGYVLAVEGAFRADDVVRGVVHPAPSVVLGTLAVAAELRFDISPLQEMLCGFLEHQDERHRSLAALVLTNCQPDSPMLRRRLLELLRQSAGPAQRHIVSLAFLRLGPPQWEELRILSQALYDAPDDLWMSLEMIMDDYGLPIEDLQFMQEPIP
jgi:hypothetical protein